MADGVALEKRRSLLLLRMGYRGTRSKTRSGFMLFLASSSFIPPKSYSFANFFAPRLSQQPPEPVIEKQGMCVNSLTPPPQPVA
jgi:hypothetical protein